MNEILVSRKKIKRNTIGPVNVDSTPEFICETCGYHADNCVCARQKTTASKPAQGIELGANGVAVKKLALSV